MESCFFNLTMLGALGLIIVPAFILLMGYKIKFPGCFAAIMVTGGLGLGAGTTLVAAMIAQADARGALFFGPVLSAPSASCNYRYQRE